MRKNQRPVAAAPAATDFFLKRISMNTQKDKIKILVLCTGNSCRSQMAEGYLRHYAGSKADVYSAGVEAHGVNPRAIAVMLEDGIDISAHTSNIISEYAGLSFDYIITVCDNAREKCPVFPSQSKRFHYNFADPAGAAGTEAQIMQQFRRVRDDIKEFACQFISAHSE